MRTNLTSSLLRAIIILVLMLSTLAFSPIARAVATLTVTNNLDSGAGSLRNTVAAALTGDIIQFAPAVTGVITLNSAITLDHGVTITGPGAAVLALDGNNATQIFNITSGTINLSGLTIKRGKNAAAGGGAIVNSSALNIANSIITNNTANGYGGAITNLGTLNVTSSTFSANQGTYGGAISNTGTTIISNSTFSANKATTSGGAIHNTSGVTITGSTFSGNQALSASGIGGAILSSGGLITLTNSTLTANTASDGAAVYDLNATLNLINSTIASNTATTGNGGITVDSSTLILRSTIVAGNTGATQDIAGVVSSDGFNLIGNTSTVIGSFIASDQVNIVPLLNPLALNAPGTTQTMSLKTNSPAIGTGGTACPTPDQRGLHRKSLCDVGAYEIQPSAYSATPTAGSTITLGATVGFSDTRTITISNGGELPLMVNTFVLGLSAPLSASPANLTVVAGTPQIVTITCTPTVGGTITQTLLYLTNDPTHPAVGYSVSCTGNPYPKDTIGVFRPSTHTFYLRRSNTTGFADITTTYGDSNSLPIVGDWNGDGIDTLGIYDKTTGLFSLTDSGTPGAPTYQFVLGVPGDTPIVGRWTSGMTHDGVGVFRPSNGLIYLKQNLTSGFADYTMVLGIPGDIGLAGDWNGDGVDSPGVYRPSKTTFYLTNKVQNGSVFGDYSVAMGAAGDLPLAGDWIGQGHAGIGIFRPSNGVMYLKNQLTAGTPDLQVIFGIANDVPLAGHWSALGTIPNSMATQAAQPTPKIAPTFVP